MDPNAPRTDYTDDDAFEPDAAANAVYRKIYRMYKTLHDAMGTTSWHGNLHTIMKDLLTIRSETRANA